MNLGIDEWALVDPVTLLQQRARGCLGDADWIVMDAAGDETAALDASGEGEGRSLSHSLAEHADAVRVWLLGQAGLWGQTPCSASSDAALGGNGILLVTSHPLILLIWFSAVVSASVPLFLGDPRWSAMELQRVVQATAPRLIIGARQTLSGTWTPRYANVLRPSRESGEVWDSQSAQNFSKSPQVFHSFPQAWGKLEKEAEVFVLKGLEPFRLGQGEPRNVENSGIFIPTGGSSGELRFVRHCWQTLVASVAGLKTSNLLPKAASIDSFCLLPLHHVSGLMQIVRSLTSGGVLVLASDFRTRRASYRDLPGRFPNIQPETYFISLVPTQLQRLLQQPEAAVWLRRFRAVLLGGAPAWPTLLAEARSQGIALAPTYGMTETASQVVTLNPQDFLRGQTGCGQVLPHAQVEVCDTAGKLVSVGQTGSVRVRSRSLAAGYVRVPTTTEIVMTEAVSGHGSLPFQPLPRDEQGSYLATDDLGFFDEAGYLHIVGRSSSKIISGGENVFPAEVEAAIRATGLVADVVVLGMPDGDWGERVVAVYVPQVLDETVSTKARLELALAEAIAPLLSPAKRPKCWWATDALPRSAQGKLNRKALQQWLAHQAVASPSAPA